MTTLKLGTAAWRTLRLAAVVATCGASTLAFAAGHGSGEAYGAYVTTSMPISGAPEVGDTGPATAPSDFFVTRIAPGFALDTPDHEVTVKTDLVLTDTVGLLAQNHVVSTSSIKNLDLSQVRGPLGAGTLLLSLKAGLITSKAEMTCVAGSSVATGSSTIEGLQIAGLILAGTQLPGNPAPNTLLLDATTNVPPWGPVTARITLNKQDAITNGVYGSGLGVSAIDVDVQWAGFSSHVVIGHSEATLDNCAGAAGSVTISVPNINASNVGAVPVSGACTPGGDHVAITTTVGSPTLNMSAACSPDGTYAVLVNGNGLPNGTGNITLMATQGTVTANTTVSKDTTAAVPTVTVTNAPVIDIANQGSYAASGTCTENNAVVTVTIGGHAVNPAPTCTGGGWSVSSVDVGSFNLPGLYAYGPVVVTASQTNGNGTGSGSRITTKDTTAPAVAVTWAPPINAANASAYHASGTCTAGDAPVTVTIGNVAAGSVPCTSGGTWSVSGVNLSGLGNSPPAITVTATQTDAAGNLGQGTRDTTKDVTPPAVTVNALPGIDAGSQGSYPISGTCTTGDGDVTVTIGNVSTTVPCNNGTWTVPGVNAGSLKFPVAIAATQTDAAGNTSTGTATVTRAVAPVPAGGAWAGLLLLASGLGLLRRRKVS